jgi:hypothetical protein
MPSARLNLSVSSGRLLKLKDLLFLNVISDYENYYPKGKKEAPKGEGSNKDSKRKSRLSRALSLVL